jgi:hypothetical protein
MIHSNSAAALASESESGHLSRREQAIMSLLQWNAKLHWTDREIMGVLSFTDMNSVRPRITTLIKRGLLEECGSMIDPLTGKRVRLVRIKQGQGKLF